ncbi:MAG: MarR family transcriptional regulator, partial [Saezia sp.]
MSPSLLHTPYWQQPHLGRLLGYALQRFDNRVLALMAEDDETPLALSNLARRHQISAAHIHITRHLPPQGARLTELAKHANMSKQAMNDLVNQCEAWGIIERADDLHDARAKLICYTPNGLAWLYAFTR